MFADPLSVTYAGAAVSLPRTGTDANASTYVSSVAGVDTTLVIRHDNKKRKRVNVSLRRESAVTDPFVPANSIRASMSASFTLDFPTTGLTTTDAQNLGKALVAFLTDANILKAAGGET